MYFILLMLQRLFNTTFYYNMMYTCVHHGTKEITYVVISVLWLICNVLLFAYKNVIRYLFILGN
jgi:hypothetical protein